MEVPRDGRGCVTIPSARARLAAIAAMTVAIANASPASAAPRRCPHGVPAPGSRFAGVGASYVAVQGVSCTTGYRLVRAWFAAAPHNQRVDGFTFTARNYVVTMRSGRQIVQFGLYGTD